MSVLANLKKYFPKVYKIEEDGLTHTILKAIARELDVKDPVDSHTGMLHDLTEAKNQHNILKSEGEFVNEWATFIKLPRYAGETDPVYAQRLVDEVVKEKLTVAAIKEWMNPYFVNPPKLIEWGRTGITVNKSYINYYVGSYASYSLIPLIRGLEFTLEVLPVQLTEYASHIYADPNTLYPYPTYISSLSGVAHHRAYVLDKGRVLKNANEKQLIDTLKRIKLAGVRANIRILRT